MLYNESSYRQISSANFSYLESCVILHSHITGINIPAFPCAIPDIGGVDVSVIQPTPFSCLITDTVNNSIAYFAPSKKTSSSVMMYNQSNICAAPAFPANISYRASFSSNPITICACFFAYSRYSCIPVM